MTARITWRQKLVLRAASNVDILPIRAVWQTNFPPGVYRSLVGRGYLHPVPAGWKITEEGRALVLWWDECDKNGRKNHEFFKRRTA